jgi:hypothetical protein
MMTTLQQMSYELTALRNLEKAVRACGLPSIMVSGQTQLETLATALKEVVEARNAEPQLQSHAA